MLPCLCLKKQKSVISDQKIDDILFGDNWNNTIKAR